MKLCWHDWEIIERKTNYQIEEDAIAKLENKPAIQIFSVALLGMRHLVKKVCLKCEKIVDQIEDYKKEVVSEYAREQRRQKFAKHLIKKKEKNKGV